MNPSSDQAVKLKRFRQTILSRKGLIAAGEGYSIALHECGRLLYAGADRTRQGEARAWTGVLSACAAGGRIAALCESGTVLTAGDDGDIQVFAERLSGVRRLALGKAHIAVLKGNGRVLLGGDRITADAPLADWPAVSDVVCGDDYTAGLTEGGLVCVYGGSPAMRYVASGWRDIAGIFADGRTLYAITAEGRLLSTARLPRAVRKWKNLVFMDAEGKHICAVTAEGRFLSTSPSPDFSEPLLACAVSESHTVTLSRRGVVSAFGRDDFGQCRTARFGSLFRYFETATADRRAKLEALDQAEHHYQIHATNHRRFADRLVSAERLTVCITAYGKILSSTAFGVCKTWSDVRRVACGNSHIIALHKDGHVSADGNRNVGCCDVEDWTDIRAIAAGNYYSLAVTMDGRVRFCGVNDKGQGDVSDWTGVRMVRTADTYTVGITYDGRVLIAGRPPFDPMIIDGSWSHPTDVVATATHLVCLYADGRVKSTVPGRAMTEAAGLDPATAAWSNIAAIAAGDGFTVGIVYGGTVLAVGENIHGRCDVAAWRDVVAVGCGDTYTAALTANGRILTAGRVSDSSSAPIDDLDRRPLPDVGGIPLSDASRWQDIITFACGPSHLVALNREGQVFACGLDTDGQCTATEHFTLFRHANGIYGYTAHSDEEEGVEDRILRKTVLPTASETHAGHD